MKVTKKGIVKLEKDEVRVGNFFVKREDDHIKISDLNDVFSFRASRKMAIGIWLENTWLRAMRGEDVGLDNLKTFIATKWTESSIVPDDEYIAEILRISQEALNRHPEWYGIKADASDEEHEQAAEEVKGMKEFEQAIKNLPDESKVQDGVGE